MTAVLHHEPRQPAGQEPQDDPRPERFQSLDPSSLLSAPGFPLGSLQIALDFYHKLNYITNIKYIVSEWATSDGLAARRHRPGGAWCSPIRRESSHSPPGRPGSGSAAVVVMTLGCAQQPSATAAEVEAPSGVTSGISSAPRRVIGGPNARNDRPQRASRARPDDLDGGGARMGGRTRGHCARPCH